MVHENPAIKPTEGWQNQPSSFFTKLSLSSSDFGFRSRQRHEKLRLLSTADTEVPISCASVCARRKFRSSKLTDRRLNRFVSCISVYPFIVVVYFNTIYAIQMRKAEFLPLLPENMIWALFILRGIPWAHSFRQWPGVRRHGRPRVDCRRWSQDRLHRARQSMGERLL